MVGLGNDMDVTTVVSLKYLTRPMLSTKCCAPFDSFGALCGAVSGRV